MTFSWFPWQHERLNTTCDLLATTFSTVHRSTQTKNHAALPLARLDLSQSAKNWYKISQHSITGTFLSQPFVFACAFPLGDCEFLCFFLGKLLNVDVYFQLRIRRIGKVPEKVHPRCSFSSPMPGQKAYIKSFLIF